MASVLSELLTSGPPEGLPRCLPKVTLKRSQENMEFYAMVIFLDRMESGLLLVGCLVGLRT